ncbi:hypothetical protein [Cylindrospermum stagnale]|uniref:hypothetical protein n=1 Tax=Cylindrospermum stagnale TaxID=142864 RepID=UPI0002E4C671|nr:hypothetical protein [Cylindrospermum stagnale]
MPNNDTPQDWGYLLTGRVSENLIRRLEGEEALNNYSQNWQLHERANELILALLGVDNALERLPHHPLLRPLREGDTKHSDGQSFLQHRVVDRWRENTAKDCENQLLPKIKIVQGLLPLLSNLDRFTAYIEIEKSFPTKGLL